mgnify:FL=1
MAETVPPMTPWRECPVCWQDQPGYIPVDEGPELPGYWDPCPACLGGTRKPLSLEAGDYWLQGAANVIARCTGHRVSQHIASAAIAAAGPWLMAQTLEELGLDWDPAQLWQEVEERMRGVPAPTEEDHRE